MSDVTFMEKTEIEGTFCPFQKGACRFGCPMLIDIDDGCAVRGIYDTLQRIGERLDELQEEKSRANPYEG